MVSLQENEALCYYAAIDLGSNSFRLSVASYHPSSQKIQIVCQEKATVRLGAHLHRSPWLTSEDSEKALETLMEFQSLLALYPNVSLRIVATNAFRVAKNAHVLCQQIEQLLGQPVEIISGEIEAQYIYYGVLATLDSELSLRRLVIDIGGGSTECIIGTQHQIHTLTSFPMGCLSFSQTYFTSDTIHSSQWGDAFYAAVEQVEPLKQIFIARGWQQVLGSSGTMKAVYALLEAENLLENGAITLQGVECFYQNFLKDRSLVEIARLRGIKPQRVMVLPGGLSILKALLFSLNISGIVPANGALRMGVLLEMVSADSGTTV